MKKTKLFQNNNLISCSDKVVVPFQGGITALLKFNNNYCYQRSLEDKEE